MACPHASERLRPFRIAQALCSGRKPVLQRNKDSNSSSSSSSSTSVKSESDGNKTQHGAVFEPLRWQACAVCATSASARKGNQKGEQRKQRRKEDVSVSTTNVDISEKAERMKRNTSENGDVRSNGGDNRVDTKQRRKSAGERSDNLKESVLGPLWVCLTCGFVCCAGNAVTDIETGNGVDSSSPGGSSNQEAFSEADSDSQDGQEIPSTVVSAPQATRDCVDHRTVHSVHTGDDDDAHVLFMNSLTHETWCVECGTPAVTASDAADESIVAVLRQCEDVITDACTELQEEPEASSDAGKNAANGWMSYLPSWISSNDRAPGNNAASSSGASLPNVRGLVGLQNLGNTCFFNATLQCIMQAQPFRSLLLQSAGDRGEVGALTEALRDILTSVWQDAELSKSNRVISPRSVFSQITKMNSRFGGFRQQDAHELLLFLLSGLRMEDAGVDLSELNPQHGSLAKIMRFFSSSRRKVAIPDDETPSLNVVDMTFLAKGTSVLVCETCHARSVMPEEILVLSLSLPALYSSREMRERTAQQLASHGALDSPNFPPPYQPEMSTIKKKWLQLVGVLPRDSKPIKTSSQGSISQKSLAPLPSDESPVSSVDSPLGGFRVPRDPTAGIAMDDFLLTDDEPDVPFAVEGVRECRSSSDGFDITALDVSESGDHTADEPVDSYESSDTSSESEGREWVLEASNEVSLDCALRRYIAPESLTGRDAVGCEKCTRRIAKLDHDRQTLRVALAAQIRATDRRTRKMRKRAARLRKLDEKRYAQSNPIAFVKSAFSKSPPPPPVETRTIDERVDAAIQAKVELKQPMTKTMEIRSLAPVLVLHLKRFQVFDGMLRKNARSVRFPLMLDMAPFLVAEGEDIPKHKVGRIMYILFGVVVHMGGMGGGHYIAYRCLNGKWYRISDTSARAVPSTEVLAAEAYMLWYQRE